jgi:hypothetical protein
MTDWDDKEEEYLTRLHHQAHLMHTYFNKKHLAYIEHATRFNIPIMVLSAINSLIALTLPSFMEQEIVSILNSVISAGTGILGSILLYMKLNEKSNQSLLLAIKFNILALKISKELSIERDKRSQSGSIFLNEAFSDFQAIIEKSLPIDRRLPNYLTLESLPSINTPPSPPATPRLRTVQSFPDIEV